MDSNRQSYQKLLIETQIFPPILTFAYCQQFKSILIETNENYQKRSFRNKYHIGSHQGMLELSVPLVKGKNNQQAIKDVRVSYDNLWPHKHWNAIQSSYGKSAFFIYYADSIKELIYSKHVFLLDLNVSAFDTVLKILTLNIPFEITKTYTAEYDNDYLDLRSKMNPKSMSNIIIPGYYQVFSGSTGFIPHLSILDLIFHLGPESLSYLVKVSTLN